MQPSELSKPFASEPCRIAFKDYMAMLSDSVMESQFEYLSFAQGENEAEGAYVTVGEICNRLILGDTVIASCYKRFQHPLGMPEMASFTADPSRYVCGESVCCVEDYDDPSECLEDGELADIAHQQRQIFCFDLSLVSSNQAASLRHLE